MIATPRELQEMDISLLLELPAWLEDECELDILNMNRDTVDNPPFLVIQSTGDKSKDTQPGSPQPGIASQSGRGASVVRNNFLFRERISMPTNKFFASCVCFLTKRGFYWFVALY